VLRQRQEKETNAWKHSFQRQVRSQVQLGNEGENEPGVKSFAFKDELSSSICQAAFCRQLTLELFARADYGSFMSLTIDQLEQEAMQLPPASRAQLADKLVESLDSAEIDEIQRLWAAEAMRRRDEVRSGRVKPIPGEEVLAEVRRMVGR